MDKIGSTVLNMHMSKGIFVTLPDRKVHIYKEYESDYLANVQAFIDKVSELNGFIDRANNSNATVVFETKTIEALTTSVKRFKEKWKNIS